MYDHFIPFYINDKFKNRIGAKMQSARIKRYKLTIEEVKNWLGIKECNEDAVQKLTEIIQKHDQIHHFPKLSMGAEIIKTIENSSHTIRKISF